MRVVAFVAAFIATVCCVGVVGSTFDLVQVQVMHRHGARGAIASYNLSMICPTADACGELNREGKDMLMQLGNYLRANYSTALGLSRNYSQYQAYTRSTDLNRTVQSADALLWGLFPEQSSFFPVVNTVNFVTDLLLLVDAQMSYHIPAVLNKMPGFKLPADYFTRVTHAALRAMGKETFQWDQCVLDSFTPNTYSLCGLRLQDIAASWNATGDLTAANAPVTMAYFNNNTLNSLRRDFNSQAYLFRPADETMAQRGNLGYTLASQIVSVMQSASGFLPRTTDIKFFQWSAHDTTYMPLASAIGMNTPHFMLPGFGQAFIFELLRDRDLGTYHVRIFNGAPTQYPSDHNYTFTELRAVGLDRTGANSSGQGDQPLLLEDFARFVESGKPQSALGSCYLDKDVTDAMQCGELGAPTDATCKLFRTTCPDAGCPANYVVNPGDLACVNAAPTQLITTGSAIVMVLASAGAGLLLGAGGVQLAHVARQKRRERGEDYLSQS